MEIQKSTLIKIRNWIIILVGVAVVGLVLSNSLQPKASEPGDTTSVQTSGDTQIINLTAKGGYSPRNIQAKAGISTVLRVATNKTFDCSSTIRVPKLNIQKTLPATGTTDIALGTQTPGTQLTIICTMGMYSSIINFV